VTGAHIELLSTPIQVKCPQKKLFSSKERLVIDFEVIYEQRERVFHRDSQTRENNAMYENTSASVFTHCFRVIEYPGEVVYMASQMNRDVTECFRLLI
jgi:hypothetical protein